MGYYTDYSLKVYNEKGQLIDSEDKEFEEVRRVFSEKVEWIDSDDLNALNTEHGVNWKWYSARRDIEEIAKELPSYYFILEGQGEENGDWWTLALHGTQIYEDEVVAPANHFDDFWVAY
jgi:hypothetical protein